MYSLTEQRVRVELLVGQMMAQRKGKYLNIKHKALCAAETVGKELDTVFCIKEISRAELIYKRRIK